jgi:cystathionine beta-synthase
VTPEKRVYDSILECIGNTPLIRLNRITKDLKCTVYAKVEFFNPAGSIKDRVAKQIIEDYEAEGRIKPGGTIIEGTSGNTGAGLALMATSRGYKSCFVMPDKQSEEKRQALRAWGAKVVITPTDVDAEDPRSYYKVSERLVQETENACYGNQYHNPSNPKAHYISTGPELWDQTEGQLDVFIAGIGTGGTIAGCAQFFKEQNSDIQVVGIDPVGSLYYDYFYSGVMTRPYTYILEGIGEDFMPSTMNFDNVDDIERVTDQECFEMARRLVSEEGIFAGASCGAALAGAMKYLKKHDREGMVAVVVLPDSAKNYLSKVFNDRWMDENGFMDGPGINGSVGDLLHAKSKRGLVSVDSDATIIDAVEMLKNHNFSQAPVMRDGNLMGILTEKSLLHHAIKGNAQREKVKELVDMDFCVVHANTELYVLTELFSRFKTALVYDDAHQPTDIITRIDLIDHMARSSKR